MVCCHACSLLVICFFINLCYHTYKNTTKWNERNSFNFCSIFISIIGITSTFFIRFTGSFGFFLCPMLIERRSSECSALNSPFPYSSLEEMVSRDITTKNYHTKKPRDLLPNFGTPKACKISSKTTKNYSESLYKGTFLTKRRN